MKLPPGFPVKLGVCVCVSHVPCCLYACEYEPVTQLKTLPPLFVSLTDIPVFPTITATVTFQEFRYDDFEESIFFIPDKYKEDPSRFPDL